jgi:two-component system response regulator AlgR
MKILLADDERLARCRLRSLLNELDDGTFVVIEAVNGEDAVQKWKQTQAEVMLLDIRMPQLTGLQVVAELARFENPPAIIFTTAYDSHALQAFEANASDYLLKPIRKDRLIAALEKARLLLQARRSQSLLQRLHADSPAPTCRSHLCVSVAGDLHLLPVADIVYFQADHKYVTAQTLQQAYLLDDSLKALEEEFADSFIRVHRNALVALRHIEELHKQGDGQVQVKFLHFPQPLVVSRRLLPQVKGRFKNFHLT